jgi:ATP-binding cassette subfamily C (CFTR/MRP) protein 1
MLTDYLATSRELKRLDAITKSPIFASFSETLNGLSTVRAFRQQRRFEALNDARIERNLEAGFLSVTANRWLAIRLEFIGSIVIFASALFAVSGLGTASQLDAGYVFPHRLCLVGVISDAVDFLGSLAGLMLSYALSVTQSLNWTVRSATEVETNVSRD